MATLAKPARRTSTAGVRTLLAGIGIGALAFLLAAFTIAPLLGLNPFGLRQETTHTVTVDSLRREEQVVLLSLGAQGIVSQKQQREVFGKPVPFSEKTQFIQYKFRAKLGIEGRDVAITKPAEHRYAVAVPSFIFIGYEDPTFELAVEKDGVLSWITPPVDTSKLITKVLDDDAKRKHISDNLQILQDQARAYYTSLITTVDPDAQVEVTFATT